MANEVLQTSANASNDVIEIARGNNLTGLKQFRDELASEISILQKKLTGLRYTAKLIREKILRNIDRKEILVRFEADGQMTIKPRQANDFVDTGIPNPPSDLSFSKDKLMEVPGIRDLVSHLNRANNQIQNAQADLTDYQNDLAGVDKQLEQAEKSGDKNQPTKADLEKDKLATARMGYTLFLYNMALLYRELTTSTDPKTNISSRGFSQDQKIVRQTMDVLKTFRAHAYSTGMEQYLDGPKKLNLEDPGDLKNLEILDADVEFDRSVAGNNKVMLDNVQKYCDRTKATITDPQGQKNIATKPDPQLDPLDSLRNKTMDLSKMIYENSNIFWTKFNQVTMFDSVKAMWKNKMTYTYSLPKCPNIPDTPEESAQNAIQTSEKAYKDGGQKLFQMSQAEAKARADRAKKEAEANIAAANKALGVLGSDATGQGSDLLAWDRQRRAQEHEEALREVAAIKQAADSGLKIMGSGTIGTAAAKEESDAVLAELKRQKVDRTEATYRSTEAVLVAISKFGTGTGITVPEGQAVLREVDRQLAEKRQKIEVEIELASEIGTPT